MRESEEKRVKRKKEGGGGVSQKHERKKRKGGRKREKGTENTHSFIIFDIRPKRELQLANHTRNQRRFQMSKVRDDDEKTCFLRVEKREVRKQNETKS